MIGSVKSMPLRFILIQMDGFGDSRINEHIEDHFLTDDSKTLFMVDVKRLPEAEKLLGRNCSFYIDGGVSEMDMEFILSNMIRK
jgi:hypothetical protein